MAGDRQTVDEDSEVLSRCRQGDTDAFELLVRKYQKRLLNTAYRMTGSYEDACEVVQDAFLSAYRGLKAFEGRSRFSTWLFTIVINLSRNRIRQIASRLRREQNSLDDPVLTEEGAIGREIPSAEPSVVERIEKRELQEKVQDCIGRLDGEFREVLVLRDIQGFSYEEIRAMLEIPEGTVKSRLFRARDALKDCLKKTIGEL